MTNTHTLSDVMERYLQSRASQKRPNTLRADRYTISKLLAFTGNIQVKHLTIRHMEGFFADRSRTCGSGTLNQDKAILSSFFKWCRAVRVAPADWDPLIGRDHLKVLQRDRLYIPASEFPRLLDCAEHPRDRIVVALGLYLFTRISETTAIKINDVDMENHWVKIVRSKTSNRDTLPMSSELHNELQRWLFHYRASCPDITPWSYLAPTMTNGSWSGNRGQRGFTLVGDKVYRPDHPHQTGWNIVKRVIEAAGYPSHREGGHTLRRSGARAWYDHLAAEGHDHAVRRVQAMLGHKNQAMTEHYIGIDGATRDRDKLLRGVPMFPAATTPVVDNVVPLREVRGEEG